MGHKLLHLQQAGRGHLNIFPDVGGTQTKVYLSQDQDQACLPSAQVSLFVPPSLSVCQSFSLNLLYHTFKINGESFSTQLLCAEKQRPPRIGN